MLGVGLENCWCSTGLIKSGTCCKSYFNKLVHELVHCFHWWQKICWVCIIEPTCTWKSGFAIATILFLEGPRIVLRWNLVQEFVSVQSPGFLNQCGKMLIAHSCTIASYKTSRWYFMMDFLWSVKQSPFRFSINDGWMIPLKAFSYLMRTAGIRNKPFKMNLL